MFVCYKTLQKMKFSISDFFNKCDLIRRKLQIWSYLLKKSLMKNFIFCAVQNITCLNLLAPNMVTKILLKSDSHLLKKKIICFNESPLKTMKNAFHFILNVLFVLKIFIWLCRKNSLIRKIRLISKFITSQPE